MLVDLRLTQAEPATWAEASRESVNKVLGALWDQDLIGIDGQRIKVLDRAGLKAHIQY